MPRYRSFSYGHLPGNIYFDTSFLLLAAIGGGDERIECARFMRRLDGHGTDVFLSVLVLLEYRHGALRAAAKEYAGDGWEKDFERPALRKEIVPYAQPIVDRLDQLLDPFAQKDKLHIVTVSADELAWADRCMRECGLDSYDASHAGVMFSYEFYDIATNDRDFDSVDGLSLWLPYELYRDLMEDS